MIDNGFIEREKFGDLRDLIARRHWEHATVTVNATETVAGRAPAHEALRRVAAAGDAGRQASSGSWTRRTSCWRCSAIRSHFDEPVTQAMSSHLVTVQADAPLSQLMEIFKKRHGGHRDERRRVSGPRDAHRPAQLAAAADVNDDEQDIEFGTRVIHGGQQPDPLTGAVMPPIYATSTYVQSSPGVHKGYEYSRTANPTRDALAGVPRESGRRHAAFAFASGHGGQRHRARAARQRLAHRRDARSLWRQLPADGERAQALGGARGDVSWISRAPRHSRRPSARTRAWCGWRRRPIRCSRSWTSRAVAQIARKRGMLSVCDNTFATPYIQRPLELRLRHRRALDDEVSERPLGCDRRRGHRARGSERCETGSRICRTRSAACRARSIRS